jgi:tyrosine-protein phosphatase SIW14
MALSDIIVSTLGQKECPEGYQTFIQLNGIKHHVIDMQGTKKVEISHMTMVSIVQLVLDQRNYPLLIHCNQGKVSSCQVLHEGSSF